MDIINAILIFLGICVIVSCIFLFFTKYYTVNDRKIILISTTIFLFIIYYYNNFLGKNWSNYQLLLLMSIYALWIFGSKLITNYYSINLQNDFNYLS
jgi:hypothetical protein